MGRLTATPGGTSGGACEHADHLADGSGGLLELRPLVVRQLELDDLLDAAGIDHGPAPTWSAVADDYDGVHLAFAGLLTGLYQPHTTAQVSTTLWAWNWESTYWLRSVFTGATPLDDLHEPPGAPQEAMR